MDSSTAKELQVRLERFHEVARILTGNPVATAREGVIWLESLARDLKVENKSYAFILTRLDSKTYGHYD